MPPGTIILEQNGLYILLSDIGTERQFHWALYLAKESSYGVIFHLINGPQTGNKWEYQVKQNTNVPNSLNLLLAIKIAVIDPAVHNSLAERLAAIPVQASSRYGPITCRVWVKEALEELDDEGYIALKEKVNIVEQEAIDTAWQNKMKRRRTVIKSPYSKA